MLINKTGCDNSEFICMAVCIPHEIENPGQSHAGPFRKNRYFSGQSEYFDNSVKQKTNILPRRKNSNPKMLYLTIQHNYKYSCTARNRTNVLPNCWIFGVFLFFVRNIGQLYAADCYTKKGS